MIYGIGIDVLKVDRIESVYKKHGERFLSHLLMPEERAQFERTARPVRFIAMRLEVVYSARGAKVRDGLGIGEGHVTLTDEAGLVVAVAVLMRRAPA